ncbi:hypothetical protein [Nocardioides sp. GXZ039]
MNLGVAIALGAAAGTVMFVITRQAYWIAIGAGLGVALGAAFGESDDEDQ